MLFLCVDTTTTIVSINVVMIDLWIQKTSLNHSARDVMQYTSDKVASWIGDSLNNSDKVW